MLTPDRRPWRNHVKCCKDRHHHELYPVDQTLALLLPGAYELGQRGMASLALGGSPRSVKRLLGNTLLSVSNKVTTSLSPSAITGVVVIKVRPT
jgi:hypothetical protein